MTPFGQYSDNEAEFESQRRQFATTANVRRNNRRRAKGLD